MNNFLVHPMRALRAAALALASVLGLPGTAEAALTVTPITWDIVGLDSNRPLTSGPNLFPVGARVCTDAATVNVQTQLVWDSGNPFIDLRPGSLTQIDFASLAAGECADAYFEIELVRDAAAFTTSRDYRIVAVDGSGSYASPTPRAIYIEQLVSQNRNSTTLIRYGQQPDESDWVVLGGGGTISLAVGETYFVELTTETATAYEELQSFLTLSNTIFQIKEVSTTYSTRTAPLARVPDPNPSLWADGCLWESDTGSPNWRSCLSDGKAGGTVVTVYEIDIISGGGDTVGLEALIYDFSGGSFHYNTDFSQSPGDLVTFDPATSGFSKRFVPSTVTPGGISRLLFTITNPNPVALSGYTFIDNLPAGVEVAPIPNATSSCGGIWNPLAGETSLSFDIDTGIIEANSSCSIGVDVTAALLGSYVNVSENLFWEGQDTGNNATATLNVDTALPPQCVDGSLVAGFDMEGAALPPLQSSGSITATASFNLAPTTAAGTPTHELVLATGTGASGNAWQGSGWELAGTTLAAADTSSFEFQVDTSTLTGGALTIDVRANPTPNGSYAAAAQNAGVIWASIDNGVSWLQVGQIGPDPPGPVFANSTFNTFSGTLSAAQMALAGPTTLFRVNFAGRKTSPSSTYTSAKVQLDDVVFRGCVTPPPGSVPSPPTLDKVFGPDFIAPGAVSTLTFLISNPNPTSPAGDLTGIAFTDSLPPSVLVAAAPTPLNSCGGTWAPAANDTVLNFSGGVLAAGASCTVSVNVTSSAIGQHLNISEFITATESGQNTTPSGSASDTLVVVPPPQIEKGFSPELVLLGVTPGNVSTLTFDIVNPSLSLALVGIAFSDSFPGGLVVAPTPNATTGAGCLTGTFTAAAGSGSVSFSGGSIAPGGTCKLSVDVTGPVGVYPNVTTAITHVVGGRTESGNTASATLTIDNPIPSVSISKQVGLSNDPNGAWFDYLVLEAPGQVFYRLVVENNGELPLTGITVSDPNVSTASCVWTDLPVADIGSPTAHISECILGPVAVNAAGEVANTATVNATGGATPVTDFDSATYATVGLTLDKTASPTSYAGAGEPITYSFLVSNTGPATLGEPVSITDPALAGVVCPALSTQGNLNNFFEAGESILCTGNYLTTATDVSNGSFTNTALATVGRFDSPQDSATITLLQPQLTMTKTASASPWTVGVAAGYTLSVQNTGTAATTAVATITDTIPASLTIGALPPGCSPSGQTVTCTIAAGLAVGDSASFVIPVTPTDAAAPSVTNTATVNGGGDPTCPADARCSSGVTTPVGRAVDLLLNKTASPNPVAVGSSLTYTLTVGNAGPGAILSSDTLSIVESLPVGLTACSYTPSAGVFNVGTIAPGSTGTGTWTGVAIPSGGSATLTIACTVSPSAAASLTNTATVLPPAGVPDPDCSGAPVVCAGNNTGAVSVTVIRPELTMTKTASAGSFTVGVPASYTLTVQNTGSAATTAVATVTDTIPSGLTIGALPPDCSSVGQTVTCTFPAGLAAGANVSFVVPVTPTLTATPSVTNTATVSGGGDSGCPAAARCSSSVTTPVGANADVAIVKTQAVPNPAVPGQSLTWTITVTNNGPSEAEAVTTADSVSPFVSGISVGGADGVACGVAGQDVTCAFGTLANGASRTFTIGGTLDAGFTGSLANTATVSSTTPDPTPGNNSSTSITPSALVADLAIVKSLLSASPVAAGGAISYQIVVTNAGPSNVVGATVEDTVPAELSGVTWICSASGSAVCGTAAGSGNILATVDIAAGGGNSVTFVISATAPLVAPVTIAANTATVTTPPAITDPNPGNNSSTVPPIPVTAFVIDAVDDTGTVASGATGGVAVPNVLVNDTLNGAPATLANVTLTQVSTSNPNVTLDPATGAVNVAPGTPAGTYTLVYQICEQLNPSNCDTATVTVTVGSPPDLALTKTDGGATVVPGGVVSYQLSYENTGTVSATGVVVTETVPASTVFNAGASTAGWSCIPNGNAGSTCTFALGTVAGGASGSVTFAVTVNNPLPGGVTQISNSATIADDGTNGPDPTPGNNTGSDTTPVVFSGVSVSKSSDPVSGTAVTASQTLTYTVTAVVTTVALTADLVLSDTLGSGLTFGSVTNAGAFTANTAGNPLVFTLPSGTVPGSYSIEYTATVDADASGTVGNSVVAAGGGDPDPECPSCTTSHPLDDPDLATIKSVDSFAPLGPGRFRVVYRIDVVNLAGAASYTLTDTFGFAVDGVSFDGPAVVSTADGSINPALPSGEFLPINGTPVQLSTNDVPIAAAGTHTYRIEVRLIVDGESLVDAQCTGGPGNGLFNATALVGVADSGSSACQSLPEGTPVIELVKTVELGVDFAGDGFGDAGDLLAYRFWIRNVGTQPLGGVHLADVRVDDLVCDAQTLAGNALRVLINDEIFGTSFSGLGVLPAGDSILCWATHELEPEDVSSRRVVNTATASGRGLSGEVVRSTSTAIYGGFR